MKQTDKQIKYSFMVNAPDVPSAVSSRSQRMMALTLLLAKASDHCRSVSSMMPSDPEVDTETRELTWCHQETITEEKHDT